MSTANKALKGFLTISQGAILIIVIITLVSFGLKSDVENSEPKEEENTIQNPVPMNWLIMTYNGDTAHVFVLEESYLVMINGRYCKSTKSGDEVLSSLIKGCVPSIPKRMTD